MDEVEFTVIAELGDAVEVERSFDNVGAVTDAETGLEDSLSRSESSLWVSGVDLCPVKEMVIKNIWLYSGTEKGKYSEKMTAGEELKIVSRRKK